MRPRVFPAEDDRFRVDDRLPARRASMRPRVFPAEDSGGRPSGDDPQPASMRPRVFPAEDAVKLHLCSSSRALQ